MRRIAQAFVLALVGAQGTPALAQEEVPWRELRVGAIALSAVRNAAFGQDVSAATGSMTGGELFASLGGAGLRVRVGGGAFTEDGGGALGDVVQGEASLFLGSREVALEGGVGRRAFAGNRSTLVVNYSRAGLAVTIPVGTSGFEGRIIGAGILPLGSELELTGYELETGLFWFAKRLPIYAALGYRYDRVTLAAEGAERPEELGAAFAGMGLSLGRARRATAAPPPSPAPRTAGTDRRE